MQKRKLLGTDLELPVIGFGASSLGQEFRSIQLDEALRSVRVALDLGINLIDTSAYYGRGMSEVLLGVALRDVPRDDYVMCTKLGRYDRDKFDFSAKRVAESVDVSLHRMGLDHVDIMLCHDIEFVDLDQIVAETMPALREAQQAGKIRYVGISGYPQKIFHEIAAKADLDCVLSYNQYTLQNTRFADETVPMLKEKGIGAMNAGPFQARLLTNAPLPPWCLETPEVRAAASKAAMCCEKHGVDVAQLALQFSCANPDMSTTIAGSANPKNIEKWAQWIDQPMDEALLAEVQQIFADVKNVGHPSGLPENN
ncbi:aldo/keto reductase [Crateriforma conspicua]|uniref:D-threo-aldose 1-dehydrogenase n=1 Tax=Crateriforma conspicua TaxID=2527996 RepID=A0A5C6FR64_9PLAN|nr:aldo/keto reductase [Crateriforma conspicua]TWU62986.1 D-threo-aldose 1-dehydrogenase [Crateriforma conspicua]